MTLHKLRLGVHPINWIGEDVLEHGDWYTAEQVMDEIQALGLHGIELVRKFPTNISVLEQALRARNLHVVSHWKSVFFSSKDKEIRKSELDKYKRHAEFLHELGSKVISTAEVGGSLLDPARPNAIQVEELDEDGWARLVDGLHQAGEICKSLGMKLVYHHHAGTVVETMDQIDRLMSSTDPELISLLYDTGHAFNAGVNPLELFTKYAHRVHYIHLKDVREDIFRVEHAKGTPFKERIRRCVFTTPGHGCVDFKSIVNAICSAGYSGWMMIEGEQDPSLYNPYKFVGYSKKYLEDLVSQAGGVLCYE